MIFYQNIARPKLPGTAFAPARSRARREGAVAVPTHDFASVPIHAPASTLTDSSACSSGRFGVNGETGCDLSTGKTLTTMHEPPACYRHCVERHEAVHARDIAPCCARAGAAYKTAKTDDAKSAIEDKFVKWMKEENVDWLECRGYTESAKCGQEYVNQNCGAKKQEADTAGSPAVENNPPVSLTQPGGTQPYIGPDAREVTRGLAEDKPDAGPGTPAPTDAGKETPGPEQCCLQLQCYARVSQGRADNVCGRAAKALTGCPV